MIAAMIGMPRPPWPSGFDVRADSGKQPQSAISTWRRPSSTSMRRWMPRGSHGAPCSTAFANASVVASVSSHVVALSSPSAVRRLAHDRASHRRALGRCR